MDKAEITALIFLAPPFALLMAMVLYAGVRMFLELEKDMREGE